MKTGKGVFAKKTIKIWQYVVKAEESRKVVVTTFPVQL